MDCHKLKNVTIGSGVSKLPAFMFIRCYDLEEINVPNTVTEISYEVFQDCTKLKKVTLGTGVKSVDHHAFYGCTALTTFVSKATTPPTLASNTFLDSNQGNANLYVPNLSLSAYKSAAYWKDFSGFSTVYDFVSGGIYYSKTSSNTVQVTFKDEKHDTYSGSVSIPSSVSYSGTTYSVTAIGPSAFHGTHLTGISIPSSVKTIEYDAFWMQGNLTSVTIPSSVTAIGSYAFCWCEALTSVTIPNSVTSMGYCAFAWCKKMTNLSIGKGLTKLEHEVFKGCEKLTVVVIPGNVTSIDYYAFKECTSLNTVNLGSGMTSIGSEVFNNCPALTSVICYNTTPPSITSSTFMSSHYSNVTLQVPVDFQNAYQNASYWKNFTHYTSLLYDIFYGGTYYRITSPTTVGIAPKNSNYNTYSGNFNHSLATLTSDTKTYNITSICDEAFKNCTGLTSVTISSPITKIGTHAFTGCTALKTFTIPNTVTTLTGSTFTSCTGLTSVTIGTGVTKLPPYMFTGCTSLAEIVIPNQVTDIGYEAFYNCTKLAKVTIGSGVKNIDAFSFAYCTKLSTIICYAKSVPTLNSTAFNNSNAYTNANLFVPNQSMSAYKSAANWKNFTKWYTLYDFAVNGIYYNITGSNTVEVTYKDPNYGSYSGNVTIPSSVTYSGKTYYVTGVGYAAFGVCGELSGVTLPNTITNIGESAFTFSTVKNMIIPNSVKTIGLQAFAISSLESITLGSGLTSIGDYAFSNCTGLTAIKSLASTPPTLAASTCFDETTYTSATLTVPYNVLNAYKNANYWKKFTNIVSTDAYDFSVNGIYYKITGTNTVSVTFKNTTYNSYSGSVNIPATVTYSSKTYNVTAIGDHAFYGSTGLTAVTIPAGVTSVQAQAFYGCKALTAVTVPSTVTSIASLSFGNCSGLKTLVLGSGLKTLAAQAFDGCNALTVVESQASTPPTMSSNNCFTSTAYSNATLKVPGASLNDYKLTDWWRMFVHIETMSYDFCVNGIYYKKLSSSTVAVTYKDENYNSYSGSIVVPATIKVGSTNYAVTGVGTAAFWKSTGLTSVQLPATVTSIGDRAFAQCTALKTATLGTGVKTIGLMAFSNCTSLTSITIPSKVTKINNQTFENCKALTQVDVPNAVTSIGMYAFMNCSGLKTLKLGSGLTSMGNSSFAGCNALTSITCLAKNPPTMADNTVFSQTTYNTAKLYVPRTSVNAYKLTDYWRLFVSIIGTDVGSDPSDVNGDGEITIADVNKVIDAILQGSHDAKYDVNGDGEVTIADVNIIINTILGV